MVTITDIARRLGVAVSTVSKGLNGASDISESTRALILKTAVETGYAGRKVQKSGVQKICVLAEKEELFSKGQFGHDLAIGFQTAAIQNGWQAATASYQGLLTSHERFNTFLLRHNYTGAFLIKQYFEPFFHSNYLNFLINLAFPLILLEEESEIPCVGNVGSDHKRGVFTAVEHLYQLGHRKIVLINGSPDSRLSKLRTPAYCEALDFFHLEYQNPLFVHRQGTESIESAVDQLLVRGATAVLCSGSTIAVSMLSRLRALGRKVPEEISVLGLEDGLGALQKSEPFTAIHQDSFSLGKAAFYMLEGLRNRIPMGSLLLRPELVLRETTGPCRESFSR